jgi:1D-myo-inositol 3-kinase
VSVEPGNPTVTRLDPAVPCPEYVIVGTITRDLVDGGFVPGGTVNYAGIAALALHRTVGAVSSVGPESSIADLVPGAQLCIRPAIVTTTFVNLYADGKRRQWLRAVAATLDLELIPPAWRAARIVHLAPLANDLDLDVFEGIRGAGLIGLTPQGWMRAWDADGFVSRRPWPDPESILRACDAVVFSEEDVEYDWALCESYARQTRLLVVTRGARGCVVYDRGTPWHVPGFPVVEVDATGAGDVFAAAFYIGLSDRGDPIEAARYANCVASFVVEAVGTNGIPAAAEISERLSTATTALVRSG